MPVHHTYVDCPECRGPGSAAIAKDSYSGERLGMSCNTCGLEVIYDDTTDTTTPTGTSAADNVNTTYPHHLGAGWYLLSNGTKRRGRTSAREAQDTLA